MLSTVRTRLHCANAFLGYLIEAGIVSADVLARRIRLRKPEALPRAVDPDDVKQLISVIGQPKDRAMIMVLLRTGMRIGELLNTKMKDLHLKIAGSIFMRGRRIGWGELFISVMMRWSP